MSKRVIHLFTDEKFVDKFAKKYANSDFQNKFVFLGKAGKYKGGLDRLAEFIAIDSAEYNDLPRRIEADYDILIVYNLCSIKSYLISQISSDRLTIVWNFFGTEIYSLPGLRRKFLSGPTIKLLKGDINFRFKLLVKNILSALRIRPSQHGLFLRAVKRVNHFAWYSIEEYNYLQSLINFKLPAYLHLSVNNILRDVRPECNKSANILLGNSRSPFNNHLDMLQLLEKCQFNNQVTVPFNYGSGKNYAAALKKRAGNMNVNVVFLEQFMAYPEYIKVINSHCAAIYNSHRQLALGNIMICIVCGLKIYLSTKNPLLAWLSNNDFRVYSIETDLENDLRSGNLSLMQSEIDLNLEAYEKLTTLNNNLKFLATLDSIAGNKKGKKGLPERTT